MRKKVLSIVMAGVIMAAGWSPANVKHVKAATAGGGEVVSPLLEIINNATASLAINGSTASVQSTVVTYSKCDIEITMRLRKKSGVEWVTVKTWTKSADNVRTLSMSKEYTVSSGTYKLFSTIDAGGERLTCTSPSKTK